MKITCVVPAYNDVFLLSRCVFSILSQVDAEYEIVITDDSSTSAVRTAVEGWMTLYPQIRYFPGPRSGNPIENWNAGIELARGDYVTVVHHDDWFARKDYLNSISSALVDAPSGSCIFAQATLVGGLRPTRFHLVSKAIAAIGRPLWSLLALNWIGPPSAFVFPNSTAERFNDKLRALVDVDFYFRVLQRRNLIKIEELSVLSGAHNAQITASFNIKTVSKDELGQIIEKDRCLSSMQVLTLRYLTNLKILLDFKAITPK